MAEPIILLPYDWMANALLKRKTDSLKRVYSEMVEAPELSAKQRCLNELEAGMKD
jgi:hypothetical protein